MGTRRPGTGKSAPCPALLLSRGWLLAGLGLLACGRGRGGPGGTAFQAGARPELPPPSARVSAPSIWEKVQDGGDVGRDCPAAGEDAALAYDPVRHRVHLFGGKGDDDVVRDELWSFDLATRRWSRIASEGPQPPPREDHTLVLDEAGDQLVLFGGENGPTSNATWTFDLRANRWTDLTCEAAPALEGHVAIYDPPGRRMVVVGGMRERILKGDKKEKTLEEETWALDLDRASPRYGSWSALPTSEPRPSPRREHRGAYDPVRRRILVFGGRQRSSGSFLNDVWALDLERQAWREIETHGERPDPIRQTTFAYDPGADEATVFGGEVLVAREGGDGRPSLVNQIWVLRLESGLWSDLTPYPRPVYDHAGLYVPECRGALIYGGSSNRAGKEHATWLLRAR